ncbi:fumarylacetoacetate hydrolase family protein [Peribacillus kribbensis]|uniref:fumarylacetoacetate hydrolase family protein n=1 Tax=Peribacillus kribbensis TaxID=356658 RepID=UPI00040FCBFE|nr:fumarylacetoacetate hydrolase family protein [Peribacillus kribbensis]
MKLATILHDGEEKVAIVENEQFYLDVRKAAQQLLNRDLPISTMLEAIKMEGFAEIAEAMAKAHKEYPGKADYEIHASEAELLAPIPRPDKNIYCVGKNYAEHAIELGSEADIPEHVMLFSKVPNTVIPHQQPIPRHREVTDALDYEGELAVIIGRKGKGISAESAMDYVFGYTVLNDITARDLQERHKQFLLGKSLDGSCPMGPYIVTRSDIADPSNLNIETKVNGEVRQSSNTSQFIFTIEDVISTISKGMTLEPGDIIATGTPAGVGKGFKPPRYLDSGDKIEITVENIGTLVNVVE